MWGHRCGVAVDFTLCVALFIASTALRPVLFMALLQTSFHLVFGRPFFLLFFLVCLSSVLFSLCVLFICPYYFNPFSYLFGCLYHSGCSSDCTFTTNSIVYYVRLRIRTTYYTTALGLNRLS